MGPNLDAIFEPLTSPGAAWVGAGIILVCFGCFAAVFGWRTSRIINDLRAALQLIRRYPDGNALAAQFEVFSKEMEANALMRLIWLEFKESLLPPTGTDRSLRNIHDSHFFFNDGAILPERINTGFWRSTPNLLTGFGIFGTFLGLVAGIYMAQSGLTAGDAEVVNESLSRLLEGAALAFTTSLFGLGTSMILSWWIHRQFHRIHSLLSEWNGCLDDRMERVSVEKLSDEALREAREQTDQLKRFNTDLAVSIAEALDKRFSERLTPVLERMIGSIDAMRESQQAMGQDTLQEVVESFRQALTGNTGEILNGLSNTLSDINERLNQSIGGFAQGQTEIAATMRALAREIEQSIRAGGTQMNEEMTQAIQNLTTSLQEASDVTAERLETTGDELAQQIAGSITALNDAVANMTQQMAALNEQSRQESEAAATRSREQLERASGELHKKVSDAGANLTQASAQAANQIAEALQTLHTSVNRFSTSVDRLDAFSTNAHEVTGNLRSLIGDFKAAADLLTEAASLLTDSANSAQEAADAIRQAVSQVASLAETIREQTGLVSSYTAETRAVWGQYQNHFTQLEQALTGVFNQLETGLAGYTQRVGDFHKDLDNHLGQALGTLSGTVGELAELLEDFNGRLGGGA